MVTKTKKYAAAAFAAVLGLASIAAANIGPIYGGKTLSSFFTVVGVVINAATSGVTAGSYTDVNVTVSANGFVSAASNGSGAGTGLYNGLLSAPVTTSILPSSLNIGGSTVTNAATGLSIVPVASSSNNLRVRYVTAPTAPYSYGAYVCMEGPLNPPTGVVQAGIGWYDGTGSLQVVSLQSNASGYELMVNNWTSVTLLQGSPYPAAINFRPCAYLGIKNDGTNIYFAWSADGVQYYVVDSFTISGAFLGSYADIAFVVNTSTNSPTGATLLSLVQNAW